MLTAVKGTSSTPSLFQHHLLRGSISQQKIHYTDYDYSITGILLILYVMFVWLFVSNYKKLSQIIKGFYVNRYANQLTREEFSIGNRVSVFLSVFFVFTLTLFICRIISYYGFHTFTNNEAVLGIITAVSITVIYIIKFFIIKLFGYIFELQKEAADYMMTVFLFGNTLGLFMLPLIVCLAFVKQVPPVFFIYAGIGIIITLFCIRIIRGVILALNSSRISKFYLFLYLCALEILPLIVMMKLFMLKIG